MILPLTPSIAFSRIGRAISSYTSLVVSEELKTRSVGNNSNMYDITLILTSHRSCRCIISTVQSETFGRSLFTVLRVLRPKGPILSMRAHAQCCKKGPFCLLPPASQKSSIGAFLICQRKNKTTINL